MAPNSLSAKSSTSTNTSSSDIKFPVTHPNPNLLTINPARSTKHTLIGAATAAENFAHVPSDIDIIVNGVSFPLHQLPLISRCDRIRELVDELRLHDHDEDISSSSSSRRNYNPDTADNESMVVVVVVELPDFPGGPDAFELAIKFCYGIDFDIGPANIAQLRCAAEYLGMSDRTILTSNLITISDSLLQSIISESVEKSVLVLHACESMLAWAEEARIVNRCIDSIASKACSKDAASVKASNSARRRLFVNELQHMGLGTSPKFLHNLMQDGHYHNHNHNHNHNHKNWSHFNNALKYTLSPLYDTNNAAASVEWWAEDVSSLRIDIYQRVLSAMRSRGLSTESLAGSLMHYAQIKLLIMTSNPSNAKPRRKKPSSLLPDQGPNLYDSKYSTNNSATRLFKAKAAAQCHEPRIVIETLLSMFPAGEKRLFPTKFLLGLLRAAITWDTTLACRLDLEHRISAQLEHASVDDLLIPTYSPVTSGECMFDVEVVGRVLETYLHPSNECQDSKPSIGSSSNDPNHVILGSLHGAPPLHLRGLNKVAKLIDSYLAEIAPDTNLKASRFISLAEMLPDRSRVVDDHLYRAVDIFIKMHPTLPEMERKKLCRVVDCQKLSEEARKHALENKRLPVEMVVQVLYFEQVRTRTQGPNHGNNNNNNNPQLPLGLLMEEMKNENDSLGLSENHGDKTSMSMQNGQGTQASMVTVNTSLELIEVVARLQDRIKELEKENDGLKHDLVAALSAIQIQDTTTRSYTTPPSTTKGGMRFFSHLFKLGRMNPFTSTSPSQSKVSSSSPRATQQQGQHDDAKTTPRRRRHSLS